VDERRAFLKIYNSMTSGKVGGLVRHISGGLIRLWWIDCEPLKAFIYMGHLKAANI